MKRSILPILLLLTLAHHSPAQEFQALTDEQLLQVVRQWRGLPEKGGLIPVSIPEGMKCGFELTTEIARRMAISSTMRSELKKLLTPLPKDTSILSASGRFRIHFDLKGFDEPALLEGDSVRIPGTAVQFAQKVAEAMDHVYNVEVTQMGYAPPPFESNTTAYNIVLRELSRLAYGQTWTVDLLPFNYASPVYTTFLELDNDFKEFYSKGLNGLNVTAAHEFHHMIQLGSYGSWHTDTYFHEMTSTWLEEVVYGEVNDYYQYLRELFTAPSTPIYAYRGGYQAVPFIQLLARQHGQDIIRQCWEEVRKAPPLHAINNVLQRPNYQSDLAAEACRFAKWNFFTGYRAPEGGSERYDEAAAYPLIKMAATSAITGNSVLFAGSVFPLATQYFRAFRGVDTTTIAVTSIDMVSALKKDLSTKSFQLEIKTDSWGSDFNPVGNGWGYKITPSMDPMMCVNLFSKDIVRNPGLVAFPNPFHPAVDGLIRFPVSLSKAETRANLGIYSTSMDRIFSYDGIEVKIDEPYGRFIGWDGKGQDGKVVPSGVYFYAVELGGEVTVGKFAVVAR